LMCFYIKFMDESTISVFRLKTEITFNTFEIKVVI